MNNKINLAIERLEQLQQQVIYAYRWTYRINSDDKYMVVQFKKRLKLINGLITAIRDDLER